MERKHEDYFTKKIFRKQFVPAIISACGLAFGDMMDGIVVGQRMGVTGLAAISLALPSFMVMNVLMHGRGPVSYTHLRSGGAQRGRRRTNTGKRRCFHSRNRTAQHVLSSINLFHHQSGRRQYCLCHQGVWPSGRHESVRRPGYGPGAVSYTHLPPSYRGETQEGSTQTMRPSCLTPPRDALSRS